MIKNKRLLSFLIFIICLLFVMKFDIVSAQVSKWVDDNYKMNRVIIFNQNDEFENRAQIQSLRKNYVVLDHSKMTLYDLKGEPLWEKDVTNQNVLLATKDDTIVVAEKKSGDVFVVDHAGNLQASHFGLGTIKEIKIFDELYVGILKTDGSLIVLNKKLEVLSTTQLPKGEIIDFNINIERQDIVAVVLDLSRKDFNTKLIIATFNGEIISGSNLLSEIVYQLHLSDDQINIITDTQMLIFDYDCNMQKTYEFDRVINKIFYDENHSQYYFNMINLESLIDAPKAKNTILQLDENGTMIKEFDPGIENIEKITMMGELLVVFNSDEVVFFNGIGKAIESYPGTDKIVDVVVANEHHFGIEYINQMKIYIQK